MSSDFRPGDLVKALELVDHNKTEIYAEGLLLNLQFYHVEGMPIKRYSNNIATILENTGEIRRFVCDAEASEWLGAVWLIPAYENNDN